MTLKPKTWYPIAIVLTLLNVVAAGFAAGEPWHAASHAVLAVGFGLWAQRLRERLRARDGEERRDTPVDDRIDAYESEVSRMREELAEVQNRLDFAERLLAQRPEPRRVGQDRVD